MGRRAKVSTKLTDELASQITSSPESFPEFTWDNAITGFGIRRYPSGKVSWIIKVKTRVKVLGRVGELSEVEARIKALMIIKDGVSAPQPQNQPTPPKPKPKHLTVEYCFEKAIKSPKFLEGRAAKTQTTTCRYLNEILARLPSLAKKNFADLKTSDLIEIKSQFEDKGASSQNNILLAVKQVWDFYRFKDPEVQKAWGDLPAMSLAGLKERREPRTDRLTPEQLKTVYSASDYLGNPYQTAFIKLSILTCRRNQTVTHMRWDDLDLEKGLWIIPPEFNKKGRGQSHGREEWLPLTDTMIEVINDVPREGPFVIGGKTPITAGSKLLAKIKQLSDIEVDDRGNSWTFHGFRRSMASSTMGALNSRVIDLIQGRVETGAAAHYYQGEYLEAKFRGLLEWELIVLGGCDTGVENRFVRKESQYSRSGQPRNTLPFKSAVRLLWDRYRHGESLSQEQSMKRLKALIHKGDDSILKYKDEKTLLKLEPNLERVLRSLPIEALEEIVKNDSRPTKAVTSRISEPTVISWEHDISGCVDVSGES
jgi:integrase